MGDADMGKVGRERFNLVIRKLSILKDGILI